MSVRIFLSLFILMMVSPMAFGQLCFPAKKVYAFFQPVTAGTMAKADAKNRQQRGNHLVYITSKSEGITLKNVWINGELHHANLLQVSTPVMPPSINQGAVKASNAALVPATKQKTYQLIFTALESQTVTPVLPKKYAASPLVLELKYKNRIKFKTVDEIKQLDPMPLQ